MKKRESPEGLTMEQVEGFLNQLDWYYKNNSIVDREVYDALNDGVEFIEGDPVQTISNVFLYYAQKEGLLDGEVFDEDTRTGNARLVNEQQSRFLKGDGISDSESLRRGSFISTDASMRYLFDEINSCLEKLENPVRNMCFYYRVATLGDSGMIDPVEFLAMSWITGKHLEKGMSPLFSQLDIVPRATDVPVFFDYDNEKFHDAFVFNASNGQPLLRYDVVYDDDFIKTMGVGATGFQFTDGSSHEQTFVGSPPVVSIPILKNPFRMESALFGISHSDVSYIPMALEYDLRCTPPIEQGQEDLELPKGITDQKGSLVRVMKEIVRARKEAELHTLTRAGVSRLTG